MMEKKLDFNGKKFAGNRKLDDIIEKATADGWEVDREHFDKFGDDSIWIRDMEGRMLQVKYNTCNGHFYVWNPSSENSVASHLSIEFEGKKWYDELLNLFYEELK